MPDGLTVNEILKLMDADNDGNADVTQGQLDIASNQNLAAVYGVEGQVEDIIRRDVTLSEAQGAAQAFSDLSEQSFDGDLDATVQFLKETVAANPEVGNVDFAEAVNSGRAAEFIAASSSAQMAGASASTAVEQIQYPTQVSEPEATSSAPMTTGLSDAETAELDAAAQVAALESSENQLAEAQAEVSMAQPGPDGPFDPSTLGTPPTQTETPSTLEGLSERFRANESVNESGFAEGIVVRQNMPNLNGDFGGAAPPVATADNGMDDIRYSQTSKVLESVGMDSGTVLADNKVQDYEFAQTISKAGYKTIEGDPTLKVEDLTQENHPEAYAKALEFGKDMNLDLKGNPEIIIGLMAVEVSGNDAIMNAVMSAQQDAMVPGINMEDPSDPSVADPASNGMRI